MLVIKKLNKQTLDVFAGAGWDNWSRFDIGSGFPKLVKGNPLSEDEYKELLSNVKLLRKVRA